MMAWIAFVITVMAVSDPYPFCWEGETAATHECAEPWSP